ncbi:MAG: apolipoprotein N-acyltransferase [Cellvibrionaceae bacterium]
MRPFALLLSSAIAGTLTTFAIPPYGYWWIAILSLAVFAYGLNQQTSKKLLLLHAFLFGLGYFGSGVSWVFVSIYQFGSASLPLALLLTSLFVIAVALFFALPFYGLGYFKNNIWRLLIGFPVFWAISEWLRSWLLTGFPWLYVGYAHIDAPLVGWAPIGGVLLIGLLSALTSSIICVVFSKSNPTNIKLLSSLFIIILWAEGASLKSSEWTQPAGDAISVGVVQPNIPQELKWDPEFREPTLEILTSLSENLWKNDWIIWPEAAIPDLYFRSEEFINKIDKKASETQTSLITGILYDDYDQQKYLNSVAGLGDADGFYFKQRLVPFGEYVPMEQWLRGIIAFFDLPTSIIAPGKPNQQMISAGNYTIASSICYEIVYPALVAELTKHSNVLITISNDAWFGKSIGPLQHFHMARMRAIETGRYVVRGTNNGVSAIIAPDGSIKHESEQFIRTAFSGEVIPMQGNTPYLIWKNYLFLAIVFILLFSMMYQHYTTNKIRATEKV